MSSSDGDAHERVPRPARKANLSKRAGLQLPVMRIHRELRRYVNHQLRVSKQASIYLAAAIEYMLAELFEITDIQRLRLDKHKRIYPKHIAAAIAADPAFLELLPLDRVHLREGRGFLKPQHKVLLQHSGKRDWATNEKQYPTSPNDLSTLNFVYGMTPAPF